MIGHRRVSGAAVGSSALQCSNDCSKIDCRGGVYGESEKLKRQGFVHKPMRRIENRMHLALVAMLVLAFAGCLDSSNPEAKGGEAAISEPYDVAFSLANVEPERFENLSRTPTWHNTFRVDERVVLALNGSTRAALIPLFYPVGSGSSTNIESLHLLYAWLDGSGNIVESSNQEIVFNLYGHKDSDVYLKWIDSELVTRGIFTSSESYGQARISGQSGVDYYMLFVGQTPPEPWANLTISLLRDPNYPTWDELEIAAGGHGARTPYEARIVANGSKYAWAQFNNDQSVQPKGIDVNFTRSSINSMVTRVEITFQETLPGSSYRIEAVHEYSEVANQNVTYSTSLGGQMEQGMFQVLSPMRDELRPTLDVHRGVRFGVADNRDAIGKTKVVISGEANVPGVAAWQLLADFGDARFEPSIQHGW